MILVSCIVLIIAKCAKTAAFIQIAKINWNAYMPEQAPPYVILICNLLPALFRTIRTQNMWLFLKKKIEKFMLKIHSHITQIFSLIHSYATECIIVDVGCKV